MPEPEPQSKLRWQRIKALFDEAVELDQDERVGWLATQCGDDGELLAELKAMLVCDQQRSGFLQPPINPVEGESQELDDGQSQVGRRVGAYKLTRVIASGGMGTVYLAARADDQFRKHVAVKLIRPGMNTVDIIRRFRNERQVLAGLERPNIARLIDGGVTEHESRPYLVME